MDPNKIQTVLEQISRGQLTVPEGMERLRDLPFEEAEGIVRIDHHRLLRLGVPEIVFGERKEVSDLITIVRRMRDRNPFVILSRLNPEKARLLLQEFPEGQYYSRSGLFTFGEPQKREGRHGRIAVLAAGTSDLPVAEEAAVTARYLGNEVETRFDVGVAGLHRLLPEIPRLRESTVVIAVAGMEGALPSVVAGLVGRPVIAVPTSVGYGANLQGVTALLAMLNSCVPGITVVNIDNGVGAAVAAHLINSPHPNPL